MNHVEKYLTDAKEIIDKMDKKQVEKMIDHLKSIKKRNGRLFFLGVGGGAANASHAVNDFRKICGFEAYTPMDNVPELSARINDEGWETVFIYWLKQSKLTENDGIFIFSVGGGNLEKNISVNLIRAIEYAKMINARVLGIVGRDGGYTAQVADACLIVPTIDSRTITAHTEAFQALISHLIVSHPELKEAEMKWESTE